jgi:hypothetical protein
MRTWVVFLVPLALACSQPTAGCGADSPVRGQWSYRAVRESPAQASISGSMTIEMRNCVDLQGSLDIVEVLPTGETRRIAGPISGTLIDSGLVRFDATLGTSDREHFARLRGDSLSGTWIELAGSMSGAGSFSGRRQVVP